MMSGLPIKSIAIAIIVIYLSISTNYINLPTDARKEFLDHVGLRLLAVFGLSYMAMDHKLDITTRVVSAGIVTLIFHLLTKKDKK